MPNVQWWDTELRLLACCKQFKTANSHIHNMLLQYWRRRGNLGGKVMRYSFPEYSLLVDLKDVFLFSRRERLKTIWMCVSLHIRNITGCAFMFEDSVSLLLNILPNCIRDTHIKYSIWGVQIRDRASHCDSCKQFWLEFWTYSTTLNMNIAHILVLREKASCSVENLSDLDACIELSFCFCAVMWEAELEISRQACHGLSIFHWCGENWRNFLVKGSRRAPVHFQYWLCSVLLSHITKPDLVWLYSALYLADILN